MPKARARKKSKGVPHTKGQTLSEYIEAQYLGSRPPPAGQRHGP